MPEIGEGSITSCTQSPSHRHAYTWYHIVARIVNYIRQHLVGKTLAVVKAQHDENVYGKVGTSAAEFEKALTGKKIMGAKQQGKYFW